ncbi:hypothetical protein vseg_004943 [Gypsophila vaccaria]
MIMQMSFQNLVPKHRYQKLITEENHGNNNNNKKTNNVSRVRRRCFWVKKTNGKMLKGVKMSKPKRVNWKAYSLIVFPRKIARIYREVVKKLIELNCGSNLILTSTWGIPVLSHASLSCAPNSFTFV